MVLNKDFKEFFELLTVHSVKYLVVGGYAVSVHGYPRYTNDIDIWLLIDRINADNLIKVLKDFGFGSLNLKTEDFLMPNRVVQLGYPPYRIDLLTSIDGVDFAECYPNRVSMKISNVMVDFVDLENLKKNKKSTGRYKDLNDLENLESL